MGLEYNITDNSGIILNASKEAIARALEEVGIHLEGEAADELENSPRRVDTGRLKGSIIHMVDGNTVTVGTNVEYAIYVHEGTRKMAPNRFLKNAFDRNYDQVKQYILSHLKNG